MRVRMEIKKRNKYYRINHLCLMIWSGVCFWGWCSLILRFEKHSLLSFQKESSRRWARVGNTFIVALKRSLSIGVKLGNSRRWGEGGSVPSLSAWRLVNPIALHHSVMHHSVTFQGFWWLVISSVKAIHKKGMNYWCVLLICGEPFSLEWSLMSFCLIFSLFDISYALKGQDITASGITRRLGRYIELTLKGWNTMPA